LQPALPGSGGEAAQESALRFFARPTNGSGQAGSRPGAPSGGRHAQPNSSQRRGGFLVLRVRRYRSRVPSKRISAGLCQPSQRVDRSPGRDL